jgi:hypothetical protein
MTLRMGDGPVANLPPGLDAYAGYVNLSGIGVTFPQIEAKYPDAEHLSITTDGHPAMCADVEAGAMSNWTGYDYGYCEVSMVNTLVKQFGRPKKLLTAHRDPSIGEHICSPRCWPGLVTTADGTQWTNHGGAWDESVLADDFFELAPPPPIQPSKEDEMNAIVMPNGTIRIYAASPTGHLLEFTRTGNPDDQSNSVIDITAQIGGANPPLVAP